MRDGDGVGGRIGRVRNTKGAEETEPSFVTWAVSDDLPLWMTVEIFLSLGIPCLGKVDAWSVYSFCKSSLAN